MLSLWLMIGLSAVDGRETAAAAAAAAAALAASCCSRSSSRLPYSPGFWAVGWTIEISGADSLRMGMFEAERKPRRLARLIVCGYRTTHRRAAAVHHAVNVARRHVHGCAAVHLLHGRLRLLQLLLLLRLLQIIDRFEHEASTKEREENHGAEGTRGIEGTGVNEVGGLPPLAESREKGVLCWRSGIKARLPYLESLLGLLRIVRELQPEFVIAAYRTPGYRNSIDQFAYQCEEGLLQEERLLADLLLLGRGGRGACSTCSRLLLLSCLQPCCQLLHALLRRGRSGGVAGAQVLEHLLRAQLHDHVVVRDGLLSGDGGPAYYLGSLTDESQGTKERR
ncbi:hypothetical protein PRIPAC_76670 [Pristionchus pacificus]|uniref:Uncharacterized protein n=1 Tax=Pristionchus pacificus TaxID=54126 RepID=A0A2A6C8S8_PRIPA|nr:hypothetical protein PRIPAC_76670 [Pristionchus pacificus]|eukprot:PDM74517.1 hypothetical protein PRIPAC_41873 [Pristionchus pacificus]